MSHIFAILIPSNLGRFISSHIFLIKYINPTNKLRIWWSFCWWIPVLNFCRAPNCEYYRFCHEESKRYPKYCTPFRQICLWKFDDYTIIFNCTDVQLQLLTHIRCKNPHGIRCQYGSSGRYSECDCIHWTDIIWPEIECCTNGSGCIETLTGSRNW